MKKESYASIGHHVKVRYLEASIEKEEAASPISFPYDWAKNSKNANSTPPSSSAGRPKSGKQPPRHVLFIHGLGSSADRWLDIPDAMSLLGFHAVAIDLPGFGGSDRPLDTDYYTVENFAQAIAEFMHKIGIDDGKTSIVGHSLGGYIAAQLAIGHRDLVDKLVLIDSSGMLQGPTPLLREYLDAAMSPSRQSVRKVFEQLVADPARIPDVLVDGFIYRIQQPNAQLAFKSAYNNSTSTQIGIKRLKLIDQKNVPTLIVWGSEDRLIPPKYCQIFKEGTRNSLAVIVKDAGHAPFAEKPAVVCELLHDFLKPYNI
ncbi:putative hydrolase or acyltransferase of alpha/beta superfamily [Candidatus Nitrososphaera evergladensis SR1]|uniref:Putative hydrolase or acyltransferase of alpha/beta superfamily n=1 Tax=Candidatus Nitrososphaera evergladensis SR1 TaxID=1459636 RepID=A0A075MMZ4_9ARCH|nr:alpha/beta hydrolase [Candidatus Nitrososphaera evergladensis]AIF82841.1 putative hydrolase or acyltransferase of alpha/beta superfamily [Candidatus Nitrososphaera evergladensis SR1]